MKVSESDYSKFGVDPNKLEVQETVFDSNGDVIENGDKPRRECAKISYNKHLDRETFFAKCDEDYNIFHPINTPQHKRAERNWSFVKVSKETFEYYLKYLQTRREYFFSYAERSMLQGR